jgi:hypothetical protein
LYAEFEWNYGSRDGVISKGFTLEGNYIPDGGDWYDEDYYKKSPRDNPKGPASGSHRVIRGGSWSFNKIHTHAALRKSNSPSNRFDYFVEGIRVVIPAP